jgi:hypothetical protein
VDPSNPNDPGPANRPKPPPSPGPGDSMAGMPAMGAKRPEPPAPPDNLPNPADVMHAVDIYMKLAYGEQIPLTIRSLLGVLRSWKGDFFRSPAIAADKEDPYRRLTIRLGNRQYPHMKLAMERSPDASVYLFRADTHDGHWLPPPEDPEYEPFRLVMEENQKIAQSIEAAWAQEGLPTFKTYLRDDLARRQAEAASGPESKS